MIEDLAQSYSDLKKHFKMHMPDFEDFYGLRDFYHLIKQISREIKKGEYLKAQNPDDELLYHVKVSIARNFGGRL